jgi:hypothetical protein
MNKASPIVYIVPEPSSMVPRTYSFRPSSRSNLAVQSIVPGTGIGFLYVVLRSMAYQFCSSVCMYNQRTYKLSCTHQAYP